MRYSIGKALFFATTSQAPGRRACRPSVTSIATASRHTGKPHEHRREIARRLRQQGRGA